MLGFVQTHQLFFFGDAHGEELVQQIEECVTDAKAPEEAQAHAFHLNQHLLHTGKTIKLFCVTQHPDQHRPPCTAETIDWYGADHIIQFEIT